MKDITVIFVTDNTNKCDLCIYDSDYSKSDEALIESLMKKTIVKAESSLFDLPLRSTFSDLLDNTPLEYGLKYRSLPKDIKLKSFIDNAKVTSIIVCDFATSSSNNITPIWPMISSLSDNIIDVDKPLKTVIGDVIFNGTNKKLDDCVLYSVTKSDTEIVKCPSIGNPEKFQKIAEDESLRTKDTVYVKKHSSDGSTDVVYVAKYTSTSHVEVNKKQDDSNNDYEVFRSNHFELKIDDKDYLRLACVKVDVQGSESSGKVLASFYLTRQTRVLLESCLFRIGTEHKVELHLFSQDGLTIVKSINVMMKIKRIHYSCDINSGSDPLLIDVLFTSCVK
jgi:hypothetical protein